MARPLKEIKWDVVENSIISGCSGVEIAAEFRIQKQTFYTRFRKQYGCSFQDYHTDTHCAGVAQIRRMLHAKAINNKAPGNVTALIFLARCRVGMKEPESDTYTAPKQAELDQTNEIIEMRHKIRQLEANALKL